MSRDRRQGLLLILAIAVAAVVGVWLVSREGAEAPREGTKVEERASPVGPGAPVLVGPSRRKPAEAQPEERERIPIVDSGGGEASEAPAGGPVLVRLGFVGEGPEPSRVRLKAMQDGDWQRAVTVEFAQGERERRLPDARSYQFQVWLDDWTSDQPLYGIEVPADRTIVLEIRLPSKPALLVVDAESGSPLADAVATATWASHVSRAAPGPEVITGKTYPSDPQGRIELGPSASTRSYWVIAPGHAWRHVNVPVQADPIRVPLVRGGGIHVVVDGWTDVSPPRVLATPVVADAPSASSRVGEDDRWRDWAELKRDVELETSEDDPTSLRVDGLPAGPWRVLLYRADAQSYVRPATEARVEVLLGAVTELRLSSREPLSERIEATIEIEVPPEWRKGRLTLTLDGATVANARVSEEHEAILEGAAPGPWRVTRSRLWPGAYQLAFHSDAVQHEWICFVQVATSETPIRVRLPRLATVTVIVANDRGEPLPDAAVSIYYARTAEEEFERVAGDVIDTWGESASSVERDPATGRHSARVASGRALLEVTADGYVTEERVVELAPGDASPPVEFRLRRAATVEVRILREGKVWREAGGTVTCLSAPSTSPHERNVENGVAPFTGLAQGHYDVTWKDGDRTAQASALAAAGETTIVEIEAP